MSNKTGQNVKNFVAFQTEKYTVEKPYSERKPESRTYSACVQNRAKLFCILIFYSAYDPRMWLVMIVESSFLRRSRAEDLSSWSAQKYRLKCRSKRVKISKTLSRCKRANSPLKNLFCTKSWISNLFCMRCRIGPKLFCIYSAPCRIKPKKESQ